MPALDVVLRRLIQRIRDALPGHTTASRLMAHPPTWRNAPPDQRAAAYVHYHQTRQQLRQIHIQQKIAPKIVTLLFRIVTSEPGRFVGVVAVLGALYLLLKP